MTVFVFFSISKSKLPPYLFPAIPAAAALAARGIDGGRRLWIVQALLSTALAAALLFHPVTRAEMMRLDLAAIAAPALAILLVLSWAAVLFAGNGSALALAAVAAGWATFFGAVILGWPRLPQARFNAELAAAVRKAAPPGTTLVGYKAYLNGVSWELKTPIPVADYRGELEPEFETRPEARDALFWPKERFWQTWKSDRPVVALVRMKDLVGADDRCAPRRESCAIPAATPSWPISRSSSNERAQATAEPAPLTTDRRFRSLVPRSRVSLRGANLLPPVGREIRAACRREDTAAEKALPPNPVKECIP